MKTLFLLIVFCGCAILSFAQNVHTDLLEEWVNGGWQNNEKTTYIYDNNGYLINSLGEAWDPGSSAWKNSWQEIYKNKSDGTVYQALMQNWNGISNSWINNNQTTNTYNNLNKPISRQTETWNNGGWQNNQIDTLAYDAKGYMIKTIRAAWSNSSKTWENYNLWFYANDSNGLLKQSIYQTWDSYGSNWNIATKYLYDYDTSGKIVTYVEQQPEGPTLQNSDRKTFTYNGKGMEATLQIDIWNNIKNEWSKSDLGIYSYNCDGTLDQINFQSLNPTNSWINSAKHSFTYYNTTPCKPEPILKIYPDPTADMLHIVTSDSSPSIIIVEDMQGKVVFKENMIGNSNTINIKDLAAAIYLVIVENKDQNMTSKVVKD